MEQKKNDTTDRELGMTRMLDAPVELVWEVISQPEHVAQWWGPNGFTNTITKMDLRPGGDWLLVMHGPDGTDYDNTSKFIEVVPMEKIVYEHLTFPSFITTIAIEAQGEQTFLKWHMLFDTSETLIHVVKQFGADEGMKQNVAKLQAYLAARK